MNLQLYSPCFKRSFTLQVPSSVFLVELHVKLEAEKPDHLLCHGERSPVGKLAGNADIVRLTVPDKFNLAHLDAICTTSLHYGIILIIVYNSNSITYFLCHVACRRLIVGPFQRWGGTTCANCSGMQGHPGVFCFGINSLAKHGNQLSHPTQMTIHGH